MRSFTSEADRNCVVACCCVVNAPACRSKTATPTVTPAGMTTGDGPDGDGTGDGAADDGAAAEWEAGGGWDHAATPAGRPVPHPASATARTASRSGRGTVMAKASQGSVDVWRAVYRRLLRPCRRYRSSS